MALLFSTSWKKDIKYWIPALREALPDMPIYSREDSESEIDWDAIEFAIVWEPPAGVLARCDNLKAIFNMGAGVDKILRNDDLPGDIPVVRLVDPCLTEGMVEYVTYWVLHYHRGFHRYREYQQQSTWRRHWYPRPCERRVGILGLGELGGAAATRLSDMGFNVAGWSRSKKDIPNVESFYGEGGFGPFLARTEILVCLLPLTPATEGILNAKTFAALPDGAFLINAARGRHMIEADVAAALEAGKLEGAALDVFSEEPLPAGHPFWRNPKIAITPHCASLTNPKTASAEIARNIRRLQAGEPARHIVDRGRGY
ncbi:MAG: glyoxylate/hydroxypyruvate reductase A [Rhodospirillales bacterium]